jgi:hypothetical protein
MQALRQGFWQGQKEEAVLQKADERQRRPKALS